MSSVQYLIYVLKHPVSKEIRYVGYTSKSLKHRLAYHYYDLKKPESSHKKNWLRSLPKKAIIEQIDACYDLDTVRAKEQFYISMFPNLVNSTTGGESNKVLCPEVRKRISDKLKGKMVGEKNPMFGKKRPDLKKRNLTSNPMNNPEIRQKSGSRLREMYSTSEYREIHRQLQRTIVPVICKDMEGNVVKTYPSMRSVMQDGFGKKEVALVCRGKYKQHKGFLWFYADAKAA